MCFLDPRVMDICQHMIAIYLRKLRGEKIGKCHDWAFTSPVLQLLLSGSATACLRESVLRLSEVHTEGGSSEEERRVLLN